MTEINKSDVYRKAAEVIVRDGKTTGGLTSAGERAESIKNPDLEVCALGACGRAHYELYGVLPENGVSVADAIYSEYTFITDVPFQAAYPMAAKGHENLKLWEVNDNTKLNYSAEDIALMLKNHASELDEQE